MTKEEVLDSNESNSTDFASQNNDPPPKLTKNQKRKLRNKRKKLERKTIKNENLVVDPDQESKQTGDETENDENIEIEYVPEKLEIDDTDLSSYFKVFERFSIDGTNVLGDKNQNENSEEELKRRMLERKKPMEFELKDDEPEEGGEKKISKRKLKQMTRMTISELKQKVSNPELVEMHDVTAKGM